jgi:hypothetical protein
VFGILGGLPDYSGPLNARRTGEIPGDGYTIEKILFESLPGFYVTGNLYRPSQAGRYPGVLVPIGHTQEGKPEAQYLAANLAKQGFVALTYDPIGQGEREQTYLPELGRPLSGGGGNEHIELGGWGSRAAPAGDASPLTSRPSTRALRPRRRRAISVRSAISSPVLRPIRR